MNDRMLMMYHEDNYTHITKKEFSGTETNIPYAACAPMDFTIYGASEQKADYRIAEGGSLQTVTEQGKNLFNVDKYIVSSDNNIIGFDISLLEIGKQYTLSCSEEITITKISNSTGGYNSVLRYSGDSGGPFTTWTFTMSRHANIPEGATQYLFIGLLKTGDNIHFDNDINTFSGVNIQIEEGSTATAYEPFVPSSPSAEYPSAIEPEITAGTYYIYINGEKKSVELPALYAAGGASDKVIYERFSGSLKLKKEIDEALLDIAKTIEENTAAVLSEPVYSELETGDYESGMTEVPWEIFSKNLFDAGRINHSTWQINLNVENPNSFGISINTDSAGVPIVYFGISLKKGTYKFSFDASIKNSPPTDVRPNEILVGEQRLGPPWIHVWKLGGDCENKHFSYTMTLSKDISDGCIAFYASVLNSSYSNYEAEFKNIQLEAGSAETEFEPTNHNPPESLSPSADYPHKIYPSQEFLLKSNGGGAEYSTKVLYAGCAIEVSDSSQANLTADGKHYIADYIEYDSKADTAKRYRYIDESLLDYTMQSKDQTQAVLQTPQTETITPDTDEYAFKNVKSIPGGCTVSCGTYAGGEALFPLQIKAAAKVIK